jgi:hypothetical protein
MQGFLDRDTINKVAIVDGAAGEEITYRKFSKRASMSKKEILL